MKTYFMPYTQLKRSSEQFLVTSNALPPIVRARPEPIHESFVPYAFAIPSQPEDLLRHSIMENYGYTALNAARNEFRLLLVAPAAEHERDTKLELSTIVTNSKADLPYWALSYTWGNAEPTFTVSFNGKDREVQQNLYEALTQLRPLSGYLRIWVDAVCINQQDIRERETQVAMMRDIYAGAEQVNAWLGSGDHDQSEEGFKLMRDLAARQYDEEHCSATFGSPQLETAEWVREHTNLAQGIASWLALAEVLDSPWFRRMWIIQEVVMAKTIAVMRGDISVSWESVVFPAARFLMKYVGQVLDEQCADAHLLGMRESLVHKYSNLGVNAYYIMTVGRTRLYRHALPFMMTHGHHQFTSSALYNMVKQYREFGATEPHDRVYALLGVMEANGLTMPLPMISYTRPLADLYWSFIKPHVGCTRRLDFLNDAVGLDRPRSLPSWMPAWSPGDAPAADALGEMQTTSILSLEMAPEIVFGATGTTMPLYSYNSRLGSIGFLGFFAACIGHVGPAAKNMSRREPKNIHARVQPSQEQLVSIVDSWIAMLCIEGAFPGGYPYTLDLDHRRLSLKQMRALKFIMMTNMLEEPNKWSDYRLFALYQRKLQKLEVASLACAPSPQAFMSTRSMFAIVNRRMFVSTTGDVFGLCPETTHVGDRVVFLYGCRTPMVLRRLGETKLWRLVGEAYIPGQMNGQALAVDMLRNRRGVDLDDQMFWIV